MIRHVFAWQVADGHDGDEVIKLLSDFSSEVQDVVKYWEIGKQAGDPGDNGDPWDGVLITDFLTWEDLDTYSHHPAHDALLEKLLPAVKSRAVVDFIKDENK